MTQVHQRIAYKSIAPLGPPSRRYNASVAYALGLRPAAQIAWPCSSYPASCPRPLICPNTVPNLTVSTDGGVLRCRGRCGSTTHTRERQICHKRESIYATCACQSFSFLFLSVFSTLFYSPRGVELVYVADGLPCCDFVLGRRFQREQAMGGIGWGSGARVLWYCTCSTE